MKQKIAHAKEELEQNALEKVSLSDPESRVMQHAKRYSEPAYNTQFSGAEPDYRRQRCLPGWA